MISQQRRARILKFIKLSQPKPIPFSEEIGVLSVTIQIVSKKNRFYRCFNWSAHFGSPDRRLRSQVIRVNHDFKTRVSKGRNPV